MIELMQITGLDYNSLVEITAFLLQVISFSVFMGILMYEALSGIIDCILRSLNWIAKFINDHLFRRGFGHGKKSRS